MRCYWCCFVKELFVLILESEAWLSRLWPGLGCWSWALACSAALGLDTRVYHAVRLPFPQKADTWSQPVKAWKAGNAFVILSPIFLANKCTGRYRRYLLLPNSIQSSSRPQCWNTRSVLNVLMRLLLGLLFLHGLCKGAIWFISLFMCARYN